MPEDASLSEDEERRYIEALETLPSLTRVAFLLSCRDDFAYAEIAWRCGISELDVRVADALLHVSRYIDGRLTLAGTVRRELLPWCYAWATARAREGDRRLAPGFRRIKDRRGAGRSIGWRGRLSA